MRSILCALFVASLAINAYAASPEPPLDEKRLSVHTLVREDVFAGWRSNDMERFARAEKNIELLMQQRPQSKAALLAWKGATNIYRAVLATEAGDDEKFQHHFDQTLHFFAEAKKLASRDVGVSAVVGGSYVMFADRLPERHRAQAWSDCYDSYLVMWKLQERVVGKLPVHIRGELLGGMIQSSQRTGRTEELDKYLDKMLEVSANTRYGRMAKKWKEDPQSALDTNISCKTCHASGRLEEKLARLSGE